MSAWEEVPTEWDKDWKLMTEAEQCDYLADVYVEISNYRFERTLHDRDGWYADEAGSDACRALGHTEADYEDYETHPPSFDGDPLCAATQHGVCCVQCEGECSYEMPRSIWALPGVLASVSSGAAAAPVDGEPV